MLEYSTVTTGNSNRVSRWVTWLPGALVIVSLYLVFAEGRIHWLAYASDQADLKSAVLFSTGNKVLALIAVVMLALEMTRRPSSPGRGAVCTLAVLCGLVGGFVNPLSNMARSEAIHCQNACINNLRLIDSAKNQWALENHKSDGETLTAVQLRAYMGCGAGEIMPTCPNDSLNEFTNSYAINPVGQLPTCRIIGHRHKLE